MTVGIGTHHLPTYVLSISPWGSVSRQNILGKMAIWEIMELKEFTPLKDGTKKVPVSHGSTLTAKL